MTLAVDMSEVGLGGVFHAEMRSQINMSINVYQSRAETGRIVLFVD